MRPRKDGPGDPSYKMWFATFGYIFTNNVGVDHDTIKTGGAMIPDPFGEIIAESRALGNDVVVGLCTPEKIDQSGGRRYLNARRPELYGKLVEPRPDGQAPVVHPGWRLKPQPPQAPDA